MDIAVTPNGATGSTVRAAIGSAQPGDTVTLAAGTYPAQYVGAYDRTGRTPVTLRFEPGAVVRQWTFADVRNLIVDGTQVRVTGAHSGIRVTGTTSDLVIRNARVDATDGQRGIMIQRTTDAGLPTNIVIEDSEITGSYGDLVAVYGAHNITLARNLIHNPDVRDGTLDHIDGIQLYNVDGFDIVENLIRDSRFNLFGGPHQGIIASTVGSQYIRNGRIRGNRIGPWRGTGVVIAGPNITDVVAYGNSVTQSYGGFVVKTSAVNGTTAYANAA